MHLFDQDSSEDNLEIVWGNLSELKNELLWLLEFRIDEPPERLDPIGLGTNRRYLRLILEELPPFLRNLQRERPETARHCTEMLDTCAHLRGLHPSEDPNVWSATYTGVHSLQTAVEEVQSSGDRPAQESAASSSGALKSGGRTPADESANSFVLAGDHFRIRYEAKDLTLKNMVGLRCIQELLRRPREEVFAGVLYASVTGTEIDSASVDDTLADRQALLSYREELERKQDELACLPKGCPQNYQEDLAQHILSLEAEIGRVGGLGGRLRRTGGDRERARKRVSQAITRALYKVSRVSPQLEVHLRGAIRQGEYLCYTPDRNIEWEF